MKRIMGLCVVLLLAAGPGCNTATKIYFKDRGLDFVDSFGVMKSFGDGIRFNVRMTKLAQFGFGWSNAQKAGFFGRQFGKWAEKRREWGLSIFYLDDFEKLPMAGNVYFHEYFKRYGGEDLYGGEFDIMHNHDRHWEDIAIDCHCFKSGCNIEWRNLQFFDFISGWFGFDIFWDDTRHRNNPETWFVIGDDVF